MKFYGDENSLKGERNGEVNSHKPEVAEFVVEEDFEQRENDQNDHSNETPARAESEPETEFESGSEDDGPDLTNNENCMFDVVQENEAQAHDHASDAEPEAQNSVPFVEQEHRFPVRSTRGIPKPQISS